MRNRMIRLAMLAGMGLSMWAVQGCSKDPAANVAKANVKPVVEPGTASTNINAPVAAGAKRLNVVTANSTLGFVGSKVTASHNGTFGSFSGTIDLVESAPEKSVVRIEIDMASVQTDEAKLTGHLQSRDFFNVAAFPKSTFESLSIAPGAGGTYTVTGKFTLHGVTREISFPATIAITANEVAVKSEFSINRKDFGIVYPGMPDNLIRDDVVIKIDLKVPKSA